MKSIVRKVLAKVPYGALGAGLSPVLGGLAWWFYQQDQLQLSAVSGVLAFLSPPVGLMFAQLKMDIAELKETATMILPPFVHAYRTAMSPNDVPDHFLPHVADQLYKKLEPAFRSLASAKSLSDEEFFASLMLEVEKLKEGDRLLAICGRKFWSKDSRELVDRYWKLNRKKARERVLIQRVFVADCGVSDSADFSEEVESTLQKHREFKADLSMESADLGGRLMVRVVNRSARDALNASSWLNAKFGFALITRDQRKIVSLLSLIHI